MTTLEQLLALAMQGIGRLNAEATIGRRMTAEELAEFRKAQTVKALRDRAAKDKKRAASSADRVAKFVASRNEVGEIPAPKHPRLKEKCKYDLAAFGWYYFRPLLDHAPSEDIRNGLIKDAQECVLQGGLTAEEFARGGGKTTWIDEITPAWAMLYGHRRFPVGMGASLKASKKCLKTIKRQLMYSPELLADFPAICIPIRALGGVSQRAAAQTYHGQATNIEWGTDQITFPMLRDDSGQPLDAGCGAILAVTGIGGAIRGTNEGGLRPDMLLIDDPQTRKAAASPKMVKGIIEYIQSDALALAGHTTTIAAFLTITPQRFGDVATEIASDDKFREWSKKVQPFIKVLPPDWETLVALFVAEYAADAAAKDYQRTRSTAWYKENRALFEKMQTIDAEQYDHEREVDVCHHMLNLRAKMGKTAFDAEIMMKVVDSSSTIDITPDIVAGMVNGFPRGVCPPGLDYVVTFFDVNQQAGAGLSGVSVAFGPKRTLAVIDYVRFPADGSPLIPPNTPEKQQVEALSAAISMAIAWLAQRKYKDAKGRPIEPLAIGFDRGWMPAVIHRTLTIMRRTKAVPFQLFPQRGVGWNQLDVRKKDTIGRGDHIRKRKSDFGPYNAVMKPYWLEIALSSFTGTPLMPGSISLFGKDPSAHFQFAHEICSYKLISKEMKQVGREVLQHWSFVSTGDDHFGDALYNAIALGSWLHVYDALSSIVDPAVLGVKMPQLEQNDLFDPRQNPAIVDNATTDDGDSAPAAAQLNAANVPRPKPRATNVPRYRFKFKKGKWRK